VLSRLIPDWEKELEMIIKWLRESGLVVNNDKTEICLFHRNDQGEAIIKVTSIAIKSKKSMNVLGVVFDCKLSWKE
jgi:hypothetical protein